MQDKRRRGVSYQKRVADINRIYDEWAKTGLSNREIWRRYVYPKWGICERAFYKILNAGTNPANDIPVEQLTLFDFGNENGNNNG